MSAIIYKNLKENLMIIWDKGRKESIVHVEDVCRSIFWVLSRNTQLNIYNVSDQSPKNVSFVQKIIDQQFQIKS
jgi:dTDP-D-glucose 4,6-dehydratase